MTKFLFTTCFILCGVSWAFAQANDDYSKNEFFAGYSFNSADINTLTINPKRTAQNGVILEYTRYINKNFGVIVDASAHFKQSSATLNGGRFESERNQGYVLGGVQYRFASKGRVTPFVHGLAGVSIFSGSTFNATPAGNIFTNDNVATFAMGFGGGLDVSLSKRFTVRIIQADYMPTFFGTGRQDNFRLSFGIVIR